MSQKNNKIIELINKLSIDKLYSIFIKLNNINQDLLINKLSKTKKLELIYFIKLKNKNKKSFSLISFISFLFKLLFYIIILVIILLFIFYKINPDKFLIFINKIKLKINNLKVSINASTPTSTPTSTTTTPTTTATLTPTPPPTPIPTATIGPLPTNLTYESQCKFLESRIQNECGDIYGGSDNHIGAPPYNYPSNLTCNELPNNICRKGIVIFKTLCNDYILDNYAGNKYKEVIDYYNNCDLDRYTGTIDECNSYLDYIANNCCIGNPEINCDNGIPNVDCDYDGWSSECKNAFDNFDNKCRLLNIGNQPTMQTFKFFYWLNNCNKNSNNIKYISN